MKSSLLRTPVAAAEPGPFRTSARPAAGLLRAVAIAGAVCSWAIGFAAATPRSASPDPLAIPALSLPASAEGEAAPRGQPRIRFVETRHDFGKILHGDSVRHDFIFTNVGDAPLEITSVRPGCGCTTAGDWDRRVAPGQTGRIPLMLRSAGFNGPIVKTATVSTSDPTQPNLVLTLQGEVWNPVTITPATAMFQYDGGATNTETRVVRITSHLDTPLQLSAPQWTNDAFHASLKTVAEGREYELHVTLDASKARGVVNTPIFVRSPSTNAPEIRVQAYALERQPILISPAQVILPAGPLPSARRVTILVRANTPEPLSISDLAVDLPDVALNIREVQAGKVYSLTADFPAGFELEQGKRPVITAASNHARVPEIRIPVVQSRAAAASSVARPTLTPAPAGPVGSRNPATPPPPLR